MPRVLLLFLDGVGIGPADPEANPFLRAKLPVLRGLLGGEVPLLEEGRAGAGGPGPSGGTRLLPLDACLGVPGLPQSGTGQIALLTGENAPQLFGRHFGPWPPVRLRPLLEERNLLTRAVDAGLRVVFANAYPEGYPGERSSRRLAAPPLAAAAAGVLTRHRDALHRGEAVASEIVNEGWRRHLGFADLPRVSPAGAGRTLARLAAVADFTLFAHYLTDHAGHRGGMQGGIDALQRVDAFLGGVVEGLSGDTLLLVASDHGNLEDVRGHHTRNPALGLAVGPTDGGAYDAISGMGAITDVTPGILEVLGV